MTATEAYKELCKEFEFRSRTISRHNVFDEFLDFSLLCFKSERDEKENERMHSLKHYVKMFELWGTACDNDGDAYDYKEPLGDLFMEFLSNAKNGQFFTPMHLCVLIQQLVVDEMQEEKTLSDPACGSGRTLIAANYVNRNLWLFGADIDERCVKMCALNMLINTCRGEVAHMNTLSLEHWKSYHINRYNIGGMFLSSWHQTGPGISNLLPRLQESRGMEQPAHIISKQGQVTMF